MIGEIVTSAEEWDERFYGMAQYVAERFSKDPQRKVGAVLVSPDRRQTQVGYNGFPTGTPDVKAHLLDETTRQNLMVHAELNAVTQARFEVRGSTLYVTKFPCNVCAGVIANMGVARVVAPRPNYGSSQWGLRYRAAWQILQAAKVEVTTVREPTNG
jgi:dCMP deaminase